MKTFNEIIDFLYENEIDLNDISEDLLERLIKEAEVELIERNIGRDSWEQ